MLYSDALRRLERLRADTIRARGDRLRRSSLKGESRARIYPVPNYRQGSGLRQTIPAGAERHSFHFKHSSVSRGGSNTAKSIFGETTAARHQDYIDRPSAQERDPATGLPLSFGTIGEGRTARKEFWRAVEQAERFNGRVQSRLIFDLPAELDGPARQALVRDFCESAFASRNLPYWVAFHTPARTALNSAEKNFHCHAVYYERQAQRLDTGQWDFAVEEVYRTSSGNKRSRRPFRQNKHPDTDKRSWVGGLRQLFAAVANHHLQLHGHEQKYDPRSYKARGIEKTPSRHLSLHTMAVEKKGVDTKGGLTNSLIEIRHRTIQITSLRESRQRRLSSYRRMIEDAPQSSDLDQLTCRAGLVLLDQLDELGDSIDDNRRKHVATGVGEESVSGQVHRRQTWLDSELEKSFSSRAKRFRIPGYVDLVRDEIDLIKTALIDLEPFLWEAGRNKDFHGQKVEELENTFVEKEDVLFVLRPELAPAENRAGIGGSPPSRERREYLAQFILAPSSYEQLVAARIQAPSVSRREASAVQSRDCSDTPSAPLPTHTGFVEPIHGGSTPRVDRPTGSLLLPPNMDERVFARELEDVLSADAAELEARVAATRKASREARSPGEMRDAVAGLELLRLALTTHDEDDDEVERRFGPRGLRGMTRSGLSKHIEIRTTERIGPRRGIAPIDPSCPRPQGNRIIINQLEDRAPDDGTVQGMSDEQTRPSRTIDGPVRKGPTRRRSS